LIVASVNEADKVAMTLRNDCGETASFGTGSFSMIVYDRESIPFP
jgi:hypothetical protein